MRRSLTVMAVLAVLTALGCDMFSSRRVAPGGQPYLEDDGRPKNTGPEPKNVRKLLAELGFDSKNMEALKAYRDALAKAGSVAQKWSLTQAYFDSLLGDADRHNVSLAEEIKSDVCAGGPMAEIWSEHYPEIAQTVRWQAEHLEYVAERLDSREKMYWNLTLPGSQIAQTWLKILTDLDFTSQRQFEMWFKKYGSQIQWNRKVGLFVLVRGTPSPAKPSPKAPTKPPARGKGKPVPTQAPAKGTSAPTKPATKANPVPTGRPTKANPAPTTRPAPTRTVPKSTTPSRFIR